MIFIVFLLVLSLAVAVPIWTTIIKRETEKETIFRATRIVKGIELYLRKHPGALPKNLNVLVKEKFIRRHWKDPLSKGGHWYLIMQPQVSNPKYVVLVKEQDLNRYPNPAIIGVAPQATGSSVLSYNDETDYKKWLFTLSKGAGQKPKVKYWKG